MLGVVALLSGCVTGEESQRRQDEATAGKLSAYVGLSVAEFMNDFPQFQAVDGYNDRGGRTFKYQAGGGALTTPGAYGAPTVTTTFACYIQISAMPTVKAPSSPRDWKITSANHSGACNNI